MARTSSSLMIAMVNFFTLGAPPQYDGLASNAIFSLLDHLTSLYGPVPTGAVAKSPVFTSCLPAMCSGTIGSTVRCANGA